MADTAAAAGVKVFVFSTLENVEKRTEVRLCPSCDASRIREIRVYISLADPLL